ATQGIILYGGAGNDVIHGGAGTALIAGGGGHHVIHAGEGNNIIFGNAGLNIDRNALLDMKAAAPLDLRSLHALSLVRTPGQAQSEAGAGPWDALQAGNNTITAGDGNNIVFANYGRITTASPVNYLRLRGDFIEDGPAVGNPRPYIAGD